MYDIPGIVKCRMGIEENKKLKYNMYDDAHIYFFKQYIYCLLHVVNVPMYVRITLF